MAGLSLVTAGLVFRAGAFPSSTPPTCLPAISACLRGHDRLHTFDPENGPSLSAAACCSACQHQPGCFGWQLDAVGSAQQQCWLLPGFAIKPGNASGCISGAMAAPPNPARVNHSGYAGIWVQHGDTADLVNQSFVRGDSAVAG